MLAINCRRLGSCAMAPRCRLGSYAMTPRAYHRWGDALALQRASTLEPNREADPGQSGHCQSGKPHAFIRVAHAFLEGIAVVHSLLWRFVGGGHQRGLV
jgi:hypothetical protein